MSAHGFNKNLDIVLNFLINIFHLLQFSAYFQVKGTFPNKKFTPPKDYYKTSDIWDEEDITQIERVKKGQKEKKYVNLFENPLLNPNILGCVMSLLESIDKRGKILENKILVMLLLNIIAFYAGDCNFIGVFG